MVIVIVMDMYAGKGSGCTSCTSCTSMEGRICAVQLVLQAYMWMKLLIIWKHSVNEMYKK